MGTEAGGPGGVRTWVLRTDGVPTVNFSHDTCQQLPLATRWAWDCLPVIRPLQDVGRDGRRIQHKPWGSGPLEEGIPRSGVRCHGLHMSAVPWSLLGEGCSWKKKARGKSLKQPFPNLAVPYYRLGMRKILIPRCTLWRHRFNSSGVERRHW